MLKERREIEEQRLGRNKKTTIDHTYIESGEYRRKFDSISDNRELNRLIFQLAKVMLLHRTGTDYEDMYWIDLDTLDIVASELNSTKSEKIVYSRKTRKLVRRYKKNPEKHLLTIHSHPNSYPPSIDDLNSNYDNNYDIGLIVCHDGHVYLYAAREKINTNYYNITVANYLKMGYNNNEAQIYALNEIQEKFDVIFKEVTDYGTGK